MIEEALKLFDEYSRRARVLPGLWAMAPVFIVGAVLVPQQPMTALLPIVVGCGFTVLLASIVRNLGKNLERHLVSGWDGMPTTHLLRHREARNPALFDRRRKALQRLYGEPLPTRRQEAANPANADEIYVAATRRLIDQVRARKDEFPLVQHENITYGRARNMLALRPYAVGAIGLAAAIDYYVFTQKGISVGLAVVIGAHAILLGCWLCFVRESWVRQAANTYAERLFEALDRMTTLDQPAAGTNLT
jgi:hypothetical protein